MSGIDTAHDPDQRDQVEDIDDPDRVERKTEDDTSDEGVAEPSNRDTDGGDAALTDD